MNINPSLSASPQPPEQASPLAACDSHVHVFDPARFGYANNRAYTPAAAKVPQLQAMLEHTGMSRVVLVQPSVYGTDNRCLLDAMAQLGPDVARGIAVVDIASTNADELAQLHAGGVRGLRLNLHVPTPQPANNTDNTDHDPVAGANSELHAAAALVAGLPAWHLQVHAAHTLRAAVLDTLIAIAGQGVPVVLDHFAGGCATEHPDDDPALQALLDAMARLPIYVKVSAAYRLPQPNSAANLARAFYQAAPTQVLWGSDWPHTGGSGGQGRQPEQVEPFRTVDNLAALTTLRQALAESQRQTLSHATLSTDAMAQLLVANPARLYGF